MRILLFLIGLLPLQAYAAFQDKLGSGPGIGEMWGKIGTIFPHTSMGNGLPYVTSQIIDFVLLVIGGAGVVVFMYAGIQMIISSGDETKLGEAKKTAMYAALGIILATLGHAIIIYVGALVSTAAGG